MTNDERPLVGLNEIYAAQDVIRPHLHRTPLAGSSYLGKRIGATLFFKLEMFQKTGSFKPRGALNNMHNLSEEKKRLGVISLSSGNHAQALAYAAAMSGIQATIVMPANAVTSKVEATRGYGGEVILTTEDLMETTLDIQRQRNLTLVHPFDNLNTIAGTGTLGLELIDDAPYADVVVVGIGGGGLISGVAAAIKQKNANVRVIGVEPEGAPGMTRSLASGVPEHLDNLDTIADGLAAPFVGQHNLDHVQAFVDDVVLVTDAQIAEAMGLILERGKVLAEAAAASTYAALLSGKVSLSGGETVICVLSGGNVDTARLVEILG
ncbi:MAG: pyridoxal-phosphate dependent enzyme [SAR202 cluster bacterium]|nr:pyridoxal-phosphate dependent enzyme [SAR202 cluster bacterium]